MSGLLLYNMYHICIGIIWVTDSVVGHYFCFFVFIAPSFISKWAMLLVAFQGNCEMEHD